ncbi:type I-E CRISPR-associated protein Cas5/CasD [Microbacterium halotolerans]|uniref:type I-E CRISPR-associated protein Cas5/CasD n=1 Tax=Microbacterium halotolerans TaxID=246613 RepID=UPI000E6AAC55|nr:type I-E CRISPR-associated protein Cas5/CasD [Microbacterium halotolerans]
MTTLLLELAAPQQSWGSRSRFASRATELAPTKSGVIGLIAAALGMERSDPLDRFVGLRFGVRIDQPGRVERDFQTARSFDGSTSFPLSHRYYLADAVFVAALDGPSEELNAYATAIRRPQYPLYLGRRAFPPSGPIHTVLVEEPLEAALQTHPWRARARTRNRTHGTRVEVEVVRDAKQNEAPDHSRDDVPVSFDPRRREYSARDVVVETIEIDHPDPPAQSAPESHSEPPVRRHGDQLLGEPTDHDPEILLADEEV